VAMLITLIDRLRCLRMELSGAGAERDPSIPQMMAGRPG
jgi:hypothetical protein